jgi:hypothetical protein
MSSKNKLTSSDIQKVKFTNKDTNKSIDIAEIINTDETKPQFLYMFFDEKQRENTSKDLKENSENYEIEVNNTRYKAVNSVECEPSLLLSKANAKYKVFELKVSYEKLIAKKK